mgnify:CR=1 FL=1
MSIATHTTQIDNECSIVTRWDFKPGEETGVPWQNTHTRKINQDRPDDGQSLGGFSRVTKILGQKASIA